MRSTRKEPLVKETRAGIALSRGASGKDFLSLTLVSGPPSDGVFADPTEHELEAQTPEALASAISRILSTPTSIALSLPVALTDEEKKRYRAVRDVPGMELWYTTDHAVAFLNYISKELPEEELNVLFLDLTPGQAAAKVVSAEVDEGCWYFFSETKTVAGTADEIKTAEDVIDKLVTPTIKGFSSLHAIYILCPKELCFCPSLASALESHLPKTKCIRFVTLAEISHGAAASRERFEGVIITHLLGADFLALPIRVALANGQLVECVPRNISLPSKRTVVFTTASPNQTSATLAFFHGDTPIGTVVLQGLKTNPKPRIQVSVSFEDEGETSVIVEELGSSSSLAKVVACLSNPLLVNNKEDIEAYLDKHRGEDTDAVERSDNLEDGVLGKLPE